MKQAFYPIICVCFIVLQTSLVPLFRGMNCCFDLMMVMVVYISINAERPVSVCYVIVLGWLMDSLSGAPAGLYMSAYIWVFLVVQVIRNVVDARSLFFVILISAVAMLVEQGFTLFVLMVGHAARGDVRPELFMMGRQALLGFVLLPPALRLVRAGHGVWDQAVVRWGGHRLGTRG